jgi:hypothetical protein
MTRAFLAFTASLLVASVGVQASAEENRRRGTQGAFNHRSLTIPRNTLSLLAGPLSATTFGQRFGTEGLDAGFRLGQRNAAPVAGDDQIYFGTTFGVAFGLFDNLEAGALFLPFQWTPEFDFQGVAVFLTYALFQSKGFDLGVRLNFVTGDWKFNPSIPIMFRFGKSRIESGLFVPIRFEDPEFKVGLNVPLRYSFNPVPRWFFGAETGWAKSQFGQREEPMAIPLGGFLGHTRAIGSNVIDFTAGAYWDNMFVINHPTLDAVQPGLYRVLFGITIHKQVTP